MLARVVVVLVGMVASGAGQAQTAAAPQPWLCVPDQAVGFAFEPSSKSWAQRRFRVSDDKYLIRGSERTNAFGGKARWEISKFGNQEPLFLCYTDPSFPLLDCSQYNNTFILNKNTMRFQYYFSGSYLRGFDKADEDTPYIEIGKCSPL